MNQLLHGDCLDQLKSLPDNSVDLICTDPPYGYSFMGKDWDKAVPSVEVWQECLRVLKPGAFAFVMSAPRSDVLSRMIVRIEDAGFRVDFSPIYWTYASGFPKAMNIGKMVDKRLGVKQTIVGKIANPGSTNKRNAMGDGWQEEPDLTIATSPEAKALDGSYGGFQPKPAVEVIIVAMKPLSEKTYVDQALKNGKGITWLDDCRVPAAPWSRPTTQNIRGGNFGNAQGKNEAKPRTNDCGRFPANLLVSDDVLNDGRITKGATSGGKAERNSKHTEEWWAQGGGGFKSVGRSTVNHADEGSYSRYFDLDAWAKTLPFLIVPKASKGEKDAGLNDDFEEQQVMGGGGTYNAEAGRKFGAIKSAKKNSHPTVKPLKLMSYLITLGSRKGDTVLDPFLGSGTTALAAQQLGRRSIGIEREAEYIKIAEARLKNVNVQGVLLSPEYV